MKSVILITTGWGNVWSLFGTESLSDAILTSGQLDSFHFHEILFRNSNTLILEMYLKLVMSEGDHCFHTTAADALAPRRDAELLYNNINSLWLSDAM